MRTYIGIMFCVYIMRFAVRTYMVMHEEYPRKNDKTRSSAAFDVFANAALAATMLYLLR